MIDENEYNNNNNNWELENLQNMASQVDEEDEITPRISLENSYSDLRKLTENYIQSKLKSPLYVVENNNNKQDYHDDPDQYDYNDEKKNNNYNTYNNNDNYTNSNDYDSNRYSDQQGKILDQKFINCWITKNTKIK